MKPILAPLQFLQHLWCGCSSSNTSILGFI